MKPLSTVIAFFLLISSMSLCAQSPAAIKIPSQLATAKTIFVANAGSTPSYPMGATLVYTGVYQALAEGHRYTLASAPADADLVLETSYVAWYGGDHYQIPIYSTLYSQLVIRDAKTQSLLWTISEPIGSTANQKTFEKYVSDSGAKLVADLIALANGNTVAPNPATTAPRKRTSDEGKK